VLVIDCTTTGAPPPTITSVLAACISGHQLALPPATVNAFAVAFRASMTAPSPRAGAARLENQARTPDMGATALQNPLRHKN
jgi:hypothetical protein